MAEVIVRTRFGSELTPAQQKAYRTLKKLIETEENWSGRWEDHAFADSFRSYFTELEKVGEATIKRRRA
jgi:hypothetical protein